LEKWENSNWFYDGEKDQQLAILYFIKGITRLYVHRDDGGVKDLEKANLLMPVWAKPLQELSEGWT
jgi:hypothetical protein